MTLIIYNNTKEKAIGEKKKNLVHERARFIFPMVIKIIFLNYPLAGTFRR